MPRDYISRPASRDYKRGCAQMGWVGDGLERYCPGCGMLPRWCECVVRPHPSKDENRICACGHASIDHAAGDEQCYLCPCDSLTDTDPRLPLYPKDPDTMSQAADVDEVADFNATKNAFLDCLSKVLRELEFSVMVPGESPEELRSWIPDGSNRPDVGRKR